MTRLVPAASNKYGARRCVHDDHTHDSQAERARCFVLQHRERVGEIRELQRATTYPLIVNGQRVGSYRDDFSYRDLQGALIVEDVKSPATRRETAYRLRKKLVEACLGIKISEVEC